MNGKFDPLLTSRAVVSKGWSDVRSGRYSTVAGSLGGRRLPPMRFARDSGGLHGYLWAWGSRPARVVSPDVV